MESDNKSGDGAAADGGGGGGRLLVDECCSGVKNDRKRFEIELKEGETTIVSWVKLLKDSGIPVDQSPPTSPEPPKPFYQEDESRSECFNIILKKEKDEQNCRPKKQRTAISDVPEGMDVVKATKNTKIGHARVKSITVTNRINEEHSVNNGRIELPDLNVPYTVQAANTLPTHIKDESGGLVNISKLESSILEMETMVADSRRLHGDVQDADRSVSNKSRLPREIKQKLEIIARLAHSSQGRISDELITRLMSILGHWLKPKTLKRWLRDMVPSDLSSCGGDPIRFTQIKNEVIQMIKFRTPSMESKDGSDNQTMELHAAHKVKYGMDNEMEDKICDFYDIYVQGMDGIKNSEIRKFYIQLAALWPEGTMDNHGIRNAICRSKERRRTALQEKGQKKCKRKKSVLDEGEREGGLNDKNTPPFGESVVPGTPELDSAPSSKRFSPSSANTSCG